MREMPEKNLNLEINMPKRIEILKERFIREEISKQALDNIEREAIKEVYIRSTVRRLLKEIEMGMYPTKSTAINVLEDLLKEIIPQIEESYKDLGTSVEQRKSFSMHVVRAVQNLLTLDETRHEGIQEALKISLSREEDEDEEILKMLGLDDEGLIDIQTDTLTDEEKKKEEFKIVGLDETGRNMAYETFKKIEAKIVAAAELLADEGDRDVFSKYLIKNLRLYMKSFEEDLALGSSETRTK